LYDASSFRGPRLTASGGARRQTRVFDSAAWQQAASGYGND
jgi:hypothetical protein